MAKKVVIKGKLDDYGGVTQKLTHIIEQLEEYLPELDNRLKSVESKLSDTSSWVCRFTPDPNKK